MSTAIGILTVTVGLALFALSPRITRYNVALRFSEEDRLARSGPRHARIHLLTRCANVASAAVAVWVIYIGVRIIGV